MAVRNQHPDSKKFKFRELKVYASTEWLADNKKKYRQVFDRYDTTYVYAELSFYNKLFDEDDWEISIELKCFSIQRGRKEICNLPFRRKVSKYDNVVFVREGWGNKEEGAFWKRGTYYWEAWVDGERVATKYFYVEDAGREVQYDDNPYLTVESLRLYEGPYDDVLEEDRLYLKTFSAEETRYIYAEIILRNLNQEQSWQCELYSKFYNDARELKGQVVRLQRIEPLDDLIKITAGWGSNVKGSWRKDRYTAEIIFMDRLLAVIPFEMGEGFEEGIPTSYLPNQTTPLNFNSVDHQNASFDDLMFKLDGLIGLHAIKKQVRDHAKYIKFLQLRKEKGFEEKEDINVHSVFIGNPGTGKTTVAKMMGRLYQKMGLVSKGHVHEVDRVDLVGEYIGQTAPKVKEAIEKARGGVLFIDEAYALARSNDDTKDFGREVIEIIVKEMSNGKGDMVVIVAGYPKEMKHFLDSNPGLKSRFKLFFEFSDYLPQELSQIGKYACEEKGVQLSPEARKHIDDLIVKAYRRRDRTFGNARFVYDLIERSKVKLGLRIMADENPGNFPSDFLGKIELMDVADLDLGGQKELPDIPVDESLLSEALDELNDLIGIDSIKREIHELVRLVRFYRETGKDVLNSFFLHTVFIGNPGTGKTTVARILTKIYKALGVLERGHMVETDRQGLVAGFLGQTAIKTAEKIDESMGGVLFIDEAYALTMRTGGMFNDYGDEAIQTLLKRMEDQRGSFFLFVAGYPENMESFLKANPGLSSRFDKVLKFEDYNPHQLYQIAKLMFMQQSIELTPEADTCLQQYLEDFYRFRDKYFGNARAVRNLVEEAIKQQHLRLADLPAVARDDNSANTLEAVDIKAIELNKEDFHFQRPSIGYRRPASQDGD
ncbi:MAG: AAA family ATPase [Saprospiraceae bacterium]|nr:AAA family ATPase [Saprospiraceae bacterium]